MTVIRVVPAEVVRPLRRAVLRPGLPQEQSVYPQDATGLHLAAYGPGREVVGCATVSPEPLDGAPAWRLRGMATAPEVRGTGVGGALLERAMLELIRREVPLLWCNARVPAAGFYRRYGFEQSGPAFDLPQIGSHLRMTRTL